MPTKRYSMEQIVSKLRQVEVEFGRRLRTPAMCKKLGGGSEQTYYRWRKEYGGLWLDQSKRVQELERENTRLKELVADQALDNMILKEVPRETSEPVPPAASGGLCRHRLSVSVLHRYSFDGCRRASSVQLQKCIGSEERQVQVDVSRSVVSCSSSTTSSATNWRPASQRSRTGRSSSR